MGGTGNRRQCRGARHTKIDIKKAGAQKLHPRYFDQTRPNLLGWFWHHRRMQMVDFPSAIFQLVDEGITRLHNGDRFGVWVGQCHIPSTQTGRDVAADLHGAGLDCANWAVLQETDEIVVDGLWRRAWGVGHGG